MFPSLAAIDTADPPFRERTQTCPPTQVEPDARASALEPGSSDVLPSLRSAIFIQDACLQHRFIRSRDNSTVVERPERLRAVKLGLAAALSHLGSDTPSSSARSKQPAEIRAEAVDAETDDLAAALDRMNLASKTRITPRCTIPIVNSSASVDILNNAAVKFIHGDIEGDVYLEKIRVWSKDSQAKILKGESEIPEGLSQGDLYLCPGSIDAIQGAIGTVCEAVDTVISATRSNPVSSATEGGSSIANRAFVAIRPPGHHCGEDTPCGFCFVNNVAIAAAHAHLHHGINRVVVLDIDLHHGNGTQSIAWQINEETYRQTLESECEGEERPTAKPGLRMYYGSIHDILSYPCEDGKIALVQAASVSLHGPHGQFIENIHLEPYTSEGHFWDVLYKGKYKRLLQTAEEFLEATGGPGEDVLVFISCGFDACEHEYPSMSRHNRKVPTSFYHHFAKDACMFADRCAQGRLVSVLEGGYSDHALIGGALAHFTGLVGGPVDESWWNLDNLVKLERATTKRRGGRQSLTPQKPNEPWLEHAVDIFSSLDAGSAKYLTTSPSRNIKPPIPTSMTLRERKKPGLSAEPSPAPSPTGKGIRRSKSPEKAQKTSVLPVEIVHSDSASSESPSVSDLSSNAVEKAVAPKVRRVILHVRDPVNEPPRP